MALYKRTGSPFWQYDFTVRGARFRGSTETDDHEKAKKLEAKLKHDAYEETHFNKKQTISVSKACGEYWINHAQYLPSAPTIEGILEIIVNFFGKHTEIQAINDRDVTRFASWLRNKGKSNSTVNRYITVLSSLNNRMKDLGYEASEARFSKRKLAEPEGRTRYLTREELERILQEAPAYLTYPIVFAIHTGVRKENIVWLTWDQVDMEARVITFKVKSKIKGGKVHVVPMSDTVYAMLQELSEEGRDGFVFRGEGGAGNLGDFKKAWRTTLDNAGVSDFRFHDLRHTAASWIVQATGQLEMVKEILGHSKIATSMRYAHHQKNAVREIINKTFMAQIRHSNDSEATNDEE